MYGFKFEDKVTDRGKCRKNTNKESLNDIHEGIKLTCHNVILNTPWRTFCPSKGAGGFSSKNVLRCQICENFQISRHNPVSGCVACITFHNFN